MPTASDRVSIAGRSAKSVRLSRARRAALLKALADPHRLKLVERIARAGRPLSCAEARAALAVSPATLSHHIKELETSGLVQVAREGKFIYLSLRAEVWSALLASLATLAKPGHKKS